MRFVMFERWLLFFYCLLLFSAGCVFGFVFTEVGQVGFVAFLGAASSLATVGAAITAVVALNSWKAQFKLQKKYDAVVAVREFIHEESHSLIYLSSLSKHFSQYLMSRDYRALAQDFPDEVQRKWFVHISGFGKSWDVMLALLSLDEARRFSFAPADINQIIRAAKEGMMDTTFRNSPDGNAIDETIRVNELQKVLQQYSVRLSSAYVDMEFQSRILLSELTT